MLQTPSTQQLLELTEHDNDRPEVVAALAAL